MKFNELYSVLRLAIGNSDNLSHFDAMMEESDDAGDFNEQPDFHNEPLSSDGQHSYDDIDGPMNESNDDIFDCYQEYAIDELFLMLKELSNSNADAEVTCDHVMALEELYEKYFYMVEGTPYVATQDPYSRLSMVYLALAQKLEKITGKSFYQWMLPSVKITFYNVTLMSLFEYEKITDITLSDDGECIIDVLSCLQLAENDGVLRHTRLFDGQSRVLSESETCRVVNHSVQTQDYWSAIHAKLAVELHGDNVGAILMRLANNLGKGSAYDQRGGREYNSGEHANVAIAEFFQWFDALTREDRNFIGSHRAASLTNSLGDLLGYLRRPTSANYRDERYCVGIISGNIQTIVKECSSLHDVCLKKDGAATLINIENVRENVKVARAVLEKAMSGAAYRLLPIGFYNGTNQCGQSRCNRAQFLKRFSKIKNLEQCFEEKVELYLEVISSLDSIDEKIHVISALAKQRPGDMYLLGCLKKLMEVGRLESVEPLVEILYQIKDPVFFVENVFGKDKIFAQCGRTLSSSVRNSIYAQPNIIYAQPIMNAVVKKVGAMYADKLQFSRLLCRVDKESWKNIFLALATLDLPNHLDKNHYDFIYNEVQKQIVNPMDKSYFFSCCLPFAQKNNFLWGVKASHGEAPRQSKRPRR